MGDGQLLLLAYLPPLLFLLLFAAAIGWTLLVLFGRYSCEVAEEVLLVRRRLFGLIPLGTIRIPLADIESVEALPPFPTLPPGFLLYANATALEAVQLTLRRRRYWLFHRAVLTPDDIPGFVNEIVSRSCAAEIRRETTMRTFLERVPLWIVDAYAALCGGAVLFLVVAVPAVGGWSLGQGPSRVPLPTAWAIAAIVLSAALGLSMALLMLLDCARAAVAEKDPVRWLWAVGIVLFLPLAWVYYVTMWRPARLGRNPEVRG
jgi:hypothetical protein